MPGRASRECTWPGCRVLISDGSSRCERHRPAAWARKADAAESTTTGRGYGWRWQGLRERILKRDRYLCQISLAQGRIVSATEVDHKVPKFEGGTDDPDNLQAVSKIEHAKKTEAERLRGLGRR